MPLCYSYAFEANSPFLALNYKHKKSCQLAALVRGVCLVINRGAVFSKILILNYWLGYFLIVRQ